MTRLDAERRARVVLSRVVEPGTVRVQSLVAEVGAAAVCEHLAADETLTGPSEVAQRIAEVDPDQLLEQAARVGIRYVIPGDREWPSHVDQLDLCEPLVDVGGAPLGLWVRGPVQLHTLGDSVAMVGSRSASMYGMAAAEDLAGGLAQRGRVVVSGAAFGIDYAAHRGALAADGLTVAVLASGVDRPYPTAHRELINYIGEHGAVVSEMPLGYAPMRNRFLSRNRIIAALASGTVVVEAAARSGALSTAGWTTKLMRPLMATPGPVGSGTSEGTHHLIRSGEASLATGVDDVLEQLGEMGEHFAPEPRGPEKVRDELSRMQSRILDAVPVHTPVSAAAIAHTASVATKVAEQELLVLEQLSLVQVTSAGWRLTERAKA